MPTPSALQRQVVDQSAFVPSYGYGDLPYDLRADDFAMAMQDVYDYFFDINGYLVGKGLKRLEDMVRPQTLSGLISDMVAASLAKHSRVLVENNYHNGHPDLVVSGYYPNNAAQQGEHGVEIKSTLKVGGSVDFHAARPQWLAVFAYKVDNETEPRLSRAPMKITEVYVAPVEEADFRFNDRGARGTRTYSLHREGLKKLRRGRVYYDRG